MPSGTIVYRLTSYASLAGQDLIGTFWYDLTGSVLPQAQQLADSWQSGVRDIIRNAQSNSVQYHGVAVVNVMDATDFYSEVESVTGLVAEPYIDTAVTVTYRSNQPFYGAHTRWYRMGGVPQPWVEDGAFVAGQGAISAVEDALQATLTSGGSSFHPLWVRRPSTTGGSDTIPWPALPMNFYTLAWQVWDISDLDSRKTPGGGVL